MAKRTDHRLWFDRLRFPKPSNEKAVGEYLTSKEVTREIPQIWRRGDDVARDITISCYLAHKKLEKVETRLRHKRKIAVATRISLDKQWAELSIKEDKLRDQFEDFNKFVIENIEKRDRAAAVQAELHHLNVIRNSETQSRKEEYEEMSYMFQKIDEMVQKYWIFETYLYNVVEDNPSEFAQPSDILKRYDALKQTKNTLHKFHQQIMYKLDNAKLEYCKMINSCFMKLEGLRVRLADLNQKYEYARVNALKWEKLLLEIRTDATDKIIDLATIKESCRRMYKEICERKGIEPVFMNDYVKQLDVIKKALYDFECINKMVRALEEEKLALSEKPCVSSGTEWVSGSD